MLELLVIADDFTGALDTGVQLAKQGFVTEVRSGAPGDGALERERRTQVLVADTQSRHLSPEQANEIVRAWAEAAEKAAVPLLYKKTDSTLRGNVGAELQGALEGAGRKKLLFVPAYPRLGRTVKEGVAYLNGVPLAETPIAHDPFTPVTSSSVREVLCGQTGLPVRCAGPQEAGEALAAMEEGILCIDAWEDGQMEAIAKQIESAGRKIVLAGCAGFAEFLPPMLGAPQMAPPAPVRAKTMLVVCGSVNAVSLEQADAAEKAGYASLLLDAEQVLSKDYAQSEAGKGFCRRAAELLRSRGCLILRTVKDPGGVEATRARAKDMGLETRGLHLIVAQNLGALAAGILREQSAGVVTVFGGDTFYALVRELGGGAIAPEREVAPGTVQSALQTENGRQTVLSKAGGFGGREALTELCRTYLEERR